MNVEGPIGGMLTNRFGHRLVAVIGGLCATVGLALSAVGSNVYHLIVTFGIMTGTYYVSKSFLVSFELPSHILDLDRLLGAGVCLF